MCWEYSECGACGHITYCVSVCYCDDEEIESGSCPHRDCKSFDTCYHCNADLCEDCDEECEDCQRQHCSKDSCDDDGCHN